MKEPRFTLTELLPGSTACNVVLIVLGVAFSILAFTFQFESAIAASLSAGLGASMFIAGFIGLVNLRVLSREISRITKEPFENISLYLKIHRSGLKDIFRTRHDAIDVIFDDVEKEHGEVVIVGSSLKGLIGVGYDCSLEENTCRQKLKECVRRGVVVNVLMTHPVVAAHRVHQEGRREGDIEAEILKNMMYLLMLRMELPQQRGSLNIKLYDGTPTIFMVTTSRLMILNPYPYYSTAFSSFTFLIDGGSDIYRAYYKSHYQEAWKDSDMTLEISHDPTKAIDQIEQLIDEKDPHDSVKCIIPNEDKRKELHDLVTTLKQEVAKRLV